MRTLFRTFFAGALLALTGLACSQSEADVIAQWHFDESIGATAFDSVGSVDGALAGDANFVAGGISGNAISLTQGGSGLVNMGDNFEFAATDFSVVSWVKFNSSNVGFLAGRHNSGSVNGYFLAANTSSGYGQANKAYFYQSSSQGNSPVSATTVNDGNWHQIVGVYSLGGLAEIYVDGGLVEASNAASSINSTPTDFLIGGISSGGTPGASLTGLIDEVQLYDEALSSSQIQYLFDNPSFTTAVPEPGSGILLLIGLAGSLSLRRRKN